MSQTNHPYILSKTLFKISEKSKKLFENFQKSYYNFHKKVLENITCKNNLRDFEVVLKKL